MCALKPSGADVAAERPLLEAISRAIHDRPELSWQERFACGLLCATLRERGWQVTCPAGGLETAFVAVAPGSRAGGPTIALLSEYDALPGVGHACGHNLIAAVGLGAGLGAAPVLAEHPGRIVVIGTPAEEGGAGKRVLLEAGVFDGVDAVLAFHGTHETSHVSSAAWAAQMLKVRFRGKAAHAAAAPWEGLNALDPMIQLFAAIGLMRQQAPADTRIHGIITNGGQAFNVIPELTEALIAARSYDTPTMYRLMERLRTLVEAAALATGCTAEAWSEHAIEGIRFVPALAELAAAAAAETGLTLGPPAPFCASTDVGNVSQVIPTLQLEIGFLPSNAPLHSAAATALTAGEAAHDAMIRAVQVLALVATRLIADSQAMPAVRRDFDAAAG